MMSNIKEILKEIEQNQDSIKKLDKMRSKINNDINLKE